MQIICWLCMLASSKQSDWLRLCLHSDCQPHLPVLVFTNIYFSTFSLSTFSICNGIHKHIFFCFQSVNLACLYWYSQTYIFLHSSISPVTEYADSRILIFTIDSQQIRNRLLKGFCLKRVPERVFLQKISWHCPYEQTSRHSKSPPSDPTFY